MEETTVNSVTTQTPLNNAMLLNVNDLPVLQNDEPEINEEKVKIIMQNIDLSDTQSILTFGTQAQKQLTQVADGMLKGVKNKDAGQAGALLNEMVVVLRGFDAKKLDPNQKQSFLSRFFGAAKPINKFITQYEEATNQIDAISNQLEKHRQNLLVDIKSLDKLYAANLDYFHELEHYIAAGDAYLEYIDQTLLPAKKAEAEADDGIIDMMETQSLRDIQQARDELERRVHDLRLTRQVAIQSLPSIRLVQENDKGLVNKITSTMINTLPLWRQQLAQAVAIFRTNEAAETLRQTSDLTNDLLKANADNLKIANAQSRQQIERGVFDIEAVEHANRSLIETIEESLRITDEGKVKRREAVERLEAAEQELKNSLLAASTNNSASVAIKDVTPRPEQIDVTPKNQE